MQYLQVSGEKYAREDNTGSSAQLKTIEHTDAVNRLGKTSFLVFKQHKYRTIPTNTIAFFYLKFETVMIVGFDRQEYALNYSLDQVQHLLTDYQFYRLNRQYLVNFNAIKEVEHYFARKLLVTLTVPVAEKLLVSKEKSHQFLSWLENR